MTQFIRPTLDLFLYDLRESLGQSEAAIKRNREQFRQKLPLEINDSVFCQQDEKYFEPEQVDLLGQQMLHPFETVLYEGYYFPVRLHDAYGLLLDCSLKASPPENDFQWLKALQAFIYEQLRHQKSSLGQTWLFHAELADYATQDHELLAKTCYETLIPEADWIENKTGQSDLLTGILFECWYVSPDQNDIQHNHHVLIAFYPDKETMDKAADLFHRSWMRLFHYHHKIMWAYAQSQQLKQQLKEGASDIQQYFQAINQDGRQLLNNQALKKALDQAWDILTKNHKQLFILDDQSRTIAINLYNYQERLRIIEQSARQELDCFRVFSDNVQNKYLQQVQQDYANFKPGFELMQNAIEYINTRLAVEEREQESDFIKIISILGVGIGTGAIVASISNQFPMVPLLNALLAHFLPKAWISPTVSILFSLSAAVLFAGLTGGLFRVVKWILKIL